MTYKIDMTKIRNQSNTAYDYYIYKDDVKIASYQAEFRGEDAEIVFNDGTRVEVGGDKGYRYAPRSDQRIEGKYYQVSKRVMEIIEEYLSNNDFKI